MKLGITIDTSGEAFKRDPSAEVAKKLRWLADYITRHGLNTAIKDGDFPLIDSNADDCGTVTYTEGDTDG